MGFITSESSLELLHKSIFYHQGTKSQRLKEKNLVVYNTLLMQEVNYKRHKAFCFSILVLADNYYSNTFKAHLI